MLQCFSIANTLHKEDMDGIYNYIASLWEKIISWGSSSSSPDQTEPSESPDKHDIPVTKPAQGLVSVQEGNSPAQPTVNSHSVQIPSQYPNTNHDEIAEVEKINLYVKSAGKTMEVDVFPMENVSVLLQEACDMAGKKPEKMTLVHDGKYLDVNESVCHYGLRRGITLNLIYAK